MPDWFEGHPADIGIFPADNEEKKKQLNEFLSTTASPQKMLPRVPKVLEEIQEKVQKFDVWGVLGYCWGGKVHGGN